MNVQDSELTNTLALVTGAGSGLGRAVAVGLAEHGAKVVLVGRRSSNLEETRAMIQANGGQAFPITADVGNPQEVEDMASKVIKEYGVPSVLLNGAGVHGDVNLIKRSDPNKWIDTFRINIIGTYLVCRAFMVEMINHGERGRIINISSAASLHTPTGINTAYSCSKIAVNLFTRHLAAELAGTGVTANVIHPGEVKTEMWAAIRDDAIASGDKIYIDWAEMVGRTGGDPPEKTIKLILDLLKPESDNINGRFLWIEDGLQKPIFTWD